MNTGVRKLQGALLRDMERAFEQGHLTDDELWSVLSAPARHVHPRVRPIASPTGRSHFWLATLFFVES